MRREKLITVRQHDAMLVGGEHDRASAYPAAEDQAQVITPDTRVAFTPGARHNSRIICRPPRIPGARYIHQRRRYCSAISAAIALRVRKDDHGIQGRHFSRS